MRSALCGKTYRTHTARNRCFKTRVSGCDWWSWTTLTGKSAFLYPTFFASRLRREFRRFDAKRPLSNNH
jgi:hypothetical protein